MIAAARPAGADLRRVALAVGELAASLGRTPTAAELAVALGAANGTARRLWLRAVAAGATATRPDPDAARRIGRRLATATTVNAARSRVAEAAARLQSEGVPTTPRAVAGAAGVSIPTAAKYLRELGLMAAPRHRDTVAAVREAWLSIEAAGLRPTAAAVAERLGLGKRTVDGCLSLLRRDGKLPPAPPADTTAAREAARRAPRRPRIAPGTEPRAGRGVGEDRWPLAPEWIWRYLDEHRRIMARNGWRAG